MDWNGRISKCFQGDQGSHLYIFLAEKQDTRDRNMQTSDRKAKICPEIKLGIFLLWVESTNTHTTIIVNQFR